MKKIIASLLVLSSVNSFALDCFKNLKLESAATGGNNTISFLVSQDKGYIIGGINVEKDSVESALLLKALDGGTVVQACGTKDGFNLVEVSHVKIKG